MWFEINSATSSSHKCLWANITNRPSPFEMKCIRSSLHTRILNRFYRNVTKSTFLLYEIMVSSNTPYFGRFNVDLICVGGKVKKRVTENWNKIWLNKKRDCANNLRVHEFRYDWMVIRVLTRWLFNGSSVTFHIVLRNRFNFNIYMRRLRQFALAAGLKRFSYQRYIDRVIHVLNNFVLDMFVFQ